MCCTRRLSAGIMCGCSLRFWHCVQWPSTRSVKPIWPGTHDALAVALAHPGGFRRIFVDLGVAAERHPGQGLAPTPAARADHSVQPLVEPLTARELQIMLMLRVPLSIKEIARRLVISYATARRHAANIYAKLGVGKRREAVVKAQALGLIPPG